MGTGNPSHRFVPTRFKNTNHLAQPLSGETKELADIRKFFRQGKRKAPLRRGEGIEQNVLVVECEIELHRMSSIKFQ